MSRCIDYDHKGRRISETIDRMDECKKLINCVCTNDRSDQCCDFPHPDYCGHRCPHFGEEDGIIEA